MRSYVGGFEAQKFVLDEALSSALPSTPDVHFAIIGEEAPCRALSDAMKERLRANPTAIAPFSLVEGNYFGSSPEAYSQLFQPASASSNQPRANGDCSPGYIDLNDESVSELARLFPRLRVVVAGAVGADKLARWKRVFHGPGAVLEVGAAEKALDFLGLENNTALLPPAPAPPPTLKKARLPSDHKHMTKQVSFMGIGAQKAGTTWLHKMLKDHPEVQMAKDKETHFFDWHRKRGLGW